MVSDFPVARGVKLKQDDKHQQNSQHFPATLPSFHRHTTIVNQPSSFIIIYHMLYMLYIYILYTYIIIYSMDHHLSYSPGGPRSGISGIYGLAPSVRMASQRSKGAMKATSTTKAPVISLPKEAALQPPIQRWSCLKG